MPEQDFPRVPREDLDHRHEALAGKLQGLEVDLVLITTNPNLYYYAGSMQEGLLAVSGQLDRPVYMVKRTYERARFDSALDDVRPAVSPTKLCEALGLNPVRRLGLELDSVPHAWAERLRRGLGGEGIELVDVSVPLREVRSVKSAWEVRMLEAAAAQSDAAMARVEEVLREGMTELEISVEVVSTLRRLGWEGLVRMHRYGSEMFVGGILSGPSATLPTFHQAVVGGWGLSPALPHGAGRRKVRPNEPVVIDLCGIHAGYITDATRTFSVGRLPEPVRTHQLAGQEILYRLERELRPGASLEGVWRLALSLAEEHGVADGFMGIGRERMRFIGHGVGLELDELPVFAEGFPGTLREGAVVALEPKLVYPDVGVLGEENTYLVTGDGPRQLTLARKGPIEV